MDAPLNGLVLAGGRSSRMGLDKAFIKWHGREQCYHLAGLLKGLCEKVFISCNQKQEQVIDKSYPVIPDLYEESGPMAAIICAFETINNCAWLVVACDHPLLDQSAVQHLVANRDASCFATAFVSDNGLPEPLLAIWEPIAFKELKNDFLKSQLSPQKLLVRNNIKLIEPPDKNVLLNVNTREDVERLSQQSPNTKIH